MLTPASQLTITTLKRTSADTKSRKSGSGNACTLWKHPHIILDCGYILQRDVAAATAYVHRYC